MNFPALDIRDVSVRYGSVQALSHASLRLKPGVVCGLVGMNGSGKSSLFKAAMGLVPCETGVVQIAGMTPEKARAAGIVSYVPQNEDIDWGFPVSVYEVVAMGLYGRLGFTRKLHRRYRSHIDEALDQVALSEYAHRQIGELSGGQRKRAFVARAITQQARVLLLDEPFAGVDYASENLLGSVLRNLASRGATVLVASHNLPSLTQMIDEAALVRQTILMHGTPADVLTPENVMNAFGGNTKAQVNHEFSA